MSYLEQVTKDIEYVRGNYADSVDNCETLEDIRETLYDALWIDDSVTGNGSGSYTMNREEAKRYVLADFETVQKALREFCVDAQTIADKFLNEDWEYFDVTARCYVLGEALDNYVDSIK